MKRYWQQYASRVDALSLRERVLVFVAAAALVVGSAYLAGLGPLLRTQAELRAQIRQQQNNLAGFDGEIVQKVKAYENDPDAPNRHRLDVVKAESIQLGEGLRAMQKGLVSPERMAPLIDTILRANGRLQLVSMRTLPVSSLNEPPPSETGADEKPGAKPDPAQAKLAAVKAALASNAPSSPLAAAGQESADRPAVAPKAGSLLYRHGVEISVRGNYLDMIDYMTALEGLPTQLFWGGARFEVEEYPTARLTLTLYTLSLDSKWLKL
jgi:MSHA biogenesis protein MshJ